MFGMLAIPLSFVFWAVFVILASGLIMAARSRSISFSTVSFLTFLLVSYTVLTLTHLAPSKLSCSTLPSDTGLPLAASVGLALTSLIGLTAMRRSSEHRTFARKASQALLLALLVFSVAPAIAGHEFNLGQPLPCPPVEAGPAAAPAP